MRGREETLQWPRAGCLSWAVLFVRAPCTLAAACAPPAASDLRRRPATWHGKPCISLRAPAAASAPAGRLDGGAARAALREGNHFWHGDSGARPYTRDHTLWQPLVSGAALRAHTMVARGVDREGGFPWTSGPVFSQILAGLLGSGLASQGLGFAALPCAASLSRPLRSQGSSGRARSKSVASQGPRTLLRRPRRRARFAGMILWPQARRHVEVDRAQSICRSTARGGAEPVGVFVDAGAEEVERVCPRRGAHRGAGAALLLRLEGGGAGAGSGLPFSRGPLSTSAHPTASLRAHHLHHPLPSQEQLMTKKRRAAA